jgi:hypothetical protein
MKSKKSTKDDYASGRERSGGTWPVLFTGLATDAPGLPQQGCGTSL